MTPDQSNSKILVKHFCQDNHACWDKGKVNSFVTPSAPEAKLQLLGFLKTLISYWKIPYIHMDRMLVSRN